MTRSLPWLIAPFLVVVVVLVGLLHLYPGLVMSGAMTRYVERAGGVNRFEFLALADHTFTAFPTPCPNQLYSHLVFDLSQRPLLLRFPAYDSFWTGQLIDARTNSFAHVSDGEQTADGVQIVLYYGRPPIGMPEGLRLIEAPSPRGLILVRHLLEKRDDLLDADALRRRMHAVPLRTRRP